MPHEKEQVVAAEIASESGTSAPRPAHNVIGNNQWFNDVEERLQAIETKLGLRAANKK